MVAEMFPIMGKEKSVFKMGEKDETKSVFMEFDYLLVGSTKY